MRTVLFACCVTSLGLTACAGSPSNPYGAERLADQRQEQQLRREQAQRDAAVAERDELITRKIRDQFAHDPLVDARDIDIDTHHGTVELHGYVDESADIRRAVRIALSTDGVRTVRNDMRVARSDVAHTGVARTDVARVDVARADVARTEVARADVAGSDQVRSSSLSLSGSTGLVK